MENIIEVRGLTKKYSKFTLGEINLDIPRGFATALIGANGAGKTTLLDAVSGIIRKTDGEVTYFGRTTDIEEDEVRNAIGYCSSVNFLPAGWTVKSTANAMSLAFDNFSLEAYDKLCAEFKLENRNDKKLKPLTKHSDGNKMRVYLASVLARNTELLILDEPASSLDPLARDVLCEKFREYLAADEKRSIIFSTHNISDMEYATDYAVFMANGKIIEQGFVEDLKDKYIIVHGDGADIDRVKPYVITVTGNKTTFEACAYSDNAAELAGFNIESERPTLQQLSVAILKKAEAEA